MLMMTAILRDDFRLVAFVIADDDDGKDEY